jgi:hypothetical protein
MLVSLQPSIADIEAEWAAEIEDRVNAFDQDEMSAHCAEEVFAKPANLCGDARTLC